jgi:ABC-type sugar transport system substrate-binding protein
MTEDTKTDAAGRRNFLKSMALGGVALGAGVVTPSLPLTKSGGAAQAAGHTIGKMAFIQWMPHTVPNAWSKGIEEVLTAQQTFDYQLLDGQNKVEVQVSLMDTLINDGASVIFLQPIDSVALAPSIASAKRRGIPVITLNIDATEEHAAHVEMNHYFGAMDIARVMGDKMGGTGEVAIMNAPPGIIIRDQRTNGFVEGMAKYHPGVKIVADVNAEWSRKKAQDVLNTVLASNPNLTGVYGVNDSMALGAVDVAKQKGILDRMTIFGNDGEKDALESIENGELTGTQYTDVYQQGRFAASVASVLASGGVSARDFQSQGKLLMPYIIATAENVGDIQTAQRW